MVANTQKSARIKSTPIHCRFNSMAMPFLGGLMIKKWSILASDDLIKDEWIHLRRHRCQRSDGSIVDPYYIISGRDWVNIMPVTRAGLVYLIREYRHGFGEILMGLPGGLIDEGESCAAAAVRELREETGLVACSPPLLTGAMVVNPSTHSNMGYSFLTIVTEPQVPLAASLESDIEVVTYSLDQLLDVVLSGSEALSGYDAASILRGFFSLRKFPEFEFDFLSRLSDRGYVR
ncbi:Hydrolase, NUDIX family (modular protein) [Cupriavidus taiwanensis]|nr:Hydrolase, NUDIX family (modular protein) [Cupriavidus taiwanensis]SOZ21704.1 Hydrolase, NUDIX family (modular protein) [Cupriavidus taiwanensis]SOZ41589.1 Hydrolase, NUDIX family (modular protein) [Cupriavidus taiwanensis]